MTNHETISTPSNPYRAADARMFDTDGLHVPYGGETRMRLTVSGGLADGRIVIDPAAQDLIAIRHGEGPEPRLQVMSGEITLSWRAFSFGDWLRDALRPSDRAITIVLHPAVDWTIAIRGGLATSELDVSAGAVAEVDVRGGCMDVRLALPPPKAAVPIRIAGGTCQLVVQRPADTGVTLDVSGGLAELRLDDQRFGAIGGSARLETRNIAPGAPRYELQLRGGASDLAIER